MARIHGGADACSKLARVSNNHYRKVEATATTIGLRLDSARATRGIGRVDRRRFANAWMAARFRRIEFPVRYLSHAQVSRLSSALSNGRTGFAG